MVDLYACTHTCKKHVYICDPDILLYSFIFVYISCVFQTSLQIPFNDFNFCT